MNTTLHNTVNTIIETDQLVKRYGAITAVDAVSLRVARGEIYGFLGLNGAGKTTTCAYPTRHREVAHRHRSVVPTLPLTVVRRIETFAEDATL